MGVEIKRELYLQQLIKRKHNGLIKVITGRGRYFDDQYIRFFKKSICMGNLSK